MTSQHTKLIFSDDRLFYIGLLLAVAPLWLANYVPGVDLPGQVAQAIALQEVLRGNPLFTDIFEINLLTPYLTGTVLLALLAWFLPAGIAVKLLLSAIVVAIPIIAGRLLGAVGGDPAWRWLLIPSSYGFALYWGFLPFLVAVPIGLFLFYLAVRFEAQTSAKLAIAIAALSLFLFFSHLLALGISCLFSLVWIAGRNLKNPKRMILLSLPFATTVPLIAWWISSSLGSGSYVANTEVVAGSLIKRLLDIVVQSSGLDGTFFAVSAVVFIIIIALPILSGMQLTRKTEKWLLAASGLATFMLFPTFGMGTAFLYDRFGLYLPLLWIILWEPSRTSSNRWHWLGMAAVLVWSGANMLRFSAFNIETRGFEVLVQKMEPGRRALSLMATRASSQFTAPVFLHFPSWYQVEQRGIVDYNFGMFYGTVLRYRAGKAPANSGTIVWNAGSFDWDTDDGEVFDYFMVRSPTDISAAIFRNHVSDVVLVGQEDLWWLYRRAD